MSIGSEVNEQRKGHSRTPDDIVDKYEPWSTMENAPVKEYLQYQRDQGFVLPEWYEVRKEREDTNPALDWLKSDLTREEHAFLTFLIWIRTAKAYLADPENWYLAYHFIEHHPIFWSRRYWKDGVDFDWNTNAGQTGMWQGVSMNNGKPVVMLEHGAAVGPSFTMHYHDHKMDVWADSFEDAYVQYAKNVHKYFTLDGYAREGVNEEGED